MRLVHITLSGLRGSAFLRGFQYISACKHWGLDHVLLK